MAHQCNYSQCVPCFREWVKFIKTRQNQASRVPGTNVVVRISEQTSIKPETPAQGYRLVYSKNPTCQRVIERRDEIEANCDPKPGNEPLISSMTWTVNEQLKAKQCDAAARTVKNMKPYMVCRPPRKRK